MWLCEAQQEETRLAPVHAYAAYGQNWDGESAAIGSCALGDPGEECRIKALSKDKAIDYGAATDSRRGRGPPTAGESLPVCTPVLSRINSQGCWQYLDTRAGLTTTLPGRTSAPKAAPLELTLRCCCCCCPPARRHQPCGHPV